MDPQPASQAPLERWIARPRKNADASARLVCIPYAGGGASVYRSWAAALPPELELCLVQLPGREARFNEPLLARSEPIVDALARALVPLADKPLAIFGHSMGALLAFELARRLEELRIEPLAIFVSGRAAPHFADRKPLHDLPAPELVAELQKLGGIPGAVLASQELMQLVLPILRADLAVAELTVPQREPLLRCPLVALGGRADALVPAAKIEGWREYTRGPFRAAWCDGGHFFLAEDRAFVLRELTSEIDARLAFGGA